MFNFLLGVVFVLLVGAIFLFFKERRKPTSAVRKTVKKELVETFETPLLALNITLRSSDVTHTMIDEVEQVIDKLRHLIPIVNTRFEGSEMAWVLNKMASDYLQKLVLPFIAINVESRASHEAKFLESLASMDKELVEVESLLDSADASTFKSKATFIKQRFQ